MIRRVITISSSRRKGCGVKSNSCNFLYFLLYPHVFRYLDKCLLKMKKYSERIDFIIDEILDQYMYADKSYRPWIIGFSGGKDSTVLLTLTWLALKK